MSSIVRGGQSAGREPVHISTDEPVDSAISRRTKTEAFVATLSVDEHGNGSRSDVLPLGCVWRLLSAAQGYGSPA
jgi:hypothetical protein